MDQLNLFEEPKAHSKPVQIKNGELPYVTLHRSVN
jgi:hypothetical protein